MADAKITELDALGATPDDADLLAIVDDVSGTATTKKVTVANLKAASGNSAILHFAHLNAKTIASGGTKYLMAWNLDLNATTEADTQLLLPKAGTIKNLYVHGSANTLDGNTVITVRENGADQALTVTLGATVTSGSDVANSFSSVAGDLISVSVDTTASSSGTITNTKVAMEIEF